jgi:5,5'-dehydrodivanillate O-demethylase
MMPNAVHFMSAAGMLRDFETFIWNVPVDDENHILFFLFLAAHLSPEAGDNVAHVVRGAREYLNELPSVEEISNSVMSGRIRWEDVEERLDLPILEDDIVLRSQGVIVDRSAERLGSSDTAIILLRKLYAREMAAIEVGRPLTRFKTLDVETLAALADG